MILLEHSSYRYYDVGSFLRYVYNTVPELAELCANMDILLSVCELGQGYIVLPWAIETYP